MDNVFSVGVFVFHDVFFFFGEGFVVEHFVGAVEVRNDEVNNFFVPAAPRVNNPGVEVSIVLDAFFHGCQGKLLLLVIAVAADLHSHRPDQAGVHHLQLVVPVVQQFALVDQLGQGQRGTGLTAADHGPVEDEGGSGEGAFFIEGTLDCLDEFDLAGVGLDVEGGEEAVVVGVVDQFGVANDDGFVGVLVVFFEGLDAEFEVSDEGGGDFNFLAAVDEAGALVVGEDAYDFEEDVDEFEDFGLVYFLGDFVLADVEGHVEEGDQFQLQLLQLEAELHLHAFHRVRLHHQLDVLLEVVLHDLRLHLLVVPLPLPLPALLPPLLLLLLAPPHHHHLLQPLQLFLELDVLHLFGGRRLFGEILAFYAEGTDHFGVELFSEDDVVVEGGFYFEVFFGFFAEISEEEHAVGDFLLEEGDLFLD